MSVPKVRLVRALVLAAFVLACLPSGATSAFAQRGGGRGGFVGFHSGFGGFHRGFGGFRGCFNCGGGRFRRGFGFGFAPGWGWAGWGWGWPGWGWGWPGWSSGWPGWAPPGWAQPGWGWSAPVAYAGGGSPYGGGGFPYAGDPPPRPSGQSCYAGAYICPINRPVPSGSACSCMSNNRTHVPGRAN